MKALFPTAAIFAELCRPSISRFKTARASSVYAANYTYSADMAFDGSGDTFWAADSGIKQAWLEVDLGASTAVSRAVIQEHFKRVTRFSLEAKQADGSWKSLVQGETIGDRLELKFPTKKAQCFRLNILQATDFPAISEMELFVK